MKFFENDVGDGSNRIIHLYLLEKYYMHYILPSSVRLYAIIAVDTNLV